MDQLFSRKTIDLIGRICLAAVFVNAVPVKITKFSSVVETISSRGIPDLLSPILLFAAILCLIAGSFSFIFLEKQKVGASLLLIFIVPTTIIFHLFPFQPQAVILNLGLIGGLILSLTRSKSIE